MAVIWWTIGLGNFAGYTRVGAVLALLGILLGSIMAIHYRFMPIGELNKNS
jgi:hypothetical protein